MPAGPIVALTIVAAVATLWPTAASLSAFWASIHDYQHGFLIGAISLAWIALVLRANWRERAEPSMSGLLLMLGTVFAWLVALRANSQMTHQLLYPVVVWSAVLASVGRPIARRLFLPIGYVYFAIPLWEQALPALQWLSVRATEGILSGLGIPAQVHEFHVTIPEGTFRIIEGCSGKRFLMVSLAVSVLAAAVNGVRGGRALLLVALAGALALVANWIRIVIVIYAGHVSDMQHHLVAVEHKTLGNVIFVILLLMIFAVARLMEARAAQRSGPSPMGAGCANAGGEGQRRLLAFLPTLTFGCVFAILQLPALALERGAGLGPLPVKAGVWLGPLPGDRTWRPAYVATDEERRAAYAKGDSRIEVYVNLYRQQRQDRELVFYGNTLLAPGNWTRAWPVTESPIADDLMSYEATGPDGRLWLLARSFEVGGRSTASDLHAQLTYGLKSIVRPVPAGVIALASRCDTNCEVARALVETFWNDVSTSFQAMVPDDASDTAGGAPGGSKN